MISKEQILAHKQELEAALVQLKANLHATEGAVHNCNHWLKVLEDSEGTMQADQPA